MKNVTFLGPIGATFSHDAYNILAGLYVAPQILEGENDDLYVPVTTNGEVLGIISKHGGYGAIAMETLAEARVTESLESFIDLLGKYSSADNCPFHVSGAVRLKLHFCLMARKLVPEETLSGIVAHPKALGACKERISSRGIATVQVPSNGEAARLVAEDDRYATYAALGPRSAAEKYHLHILNEAYEDREAVTTFFLIAPKDHQEATGKENRMLIVFKVPHTPGSLVKSLIPFDEEGINIIQIHSVHAGKQTYHFAIELEVKEDQFAALNRAMEKFKKLSEKHLSFGPFAVSS